MKQLIFLLLLLSSSALAEDNKGIQTHDMYNMCKMAMKWIDTDGATADEKKQGSYCLGYVRGVADVLQEQSSPTLHFKDVTTETLVRSFVNYVNAHSGEMDDPLGLVLLEAWKTDNIITPKAVKQ